MTSVSSYSIGICTRYPEGTYTLEMIQFDERQGVIAAAPVGDYQQLKSGAKWDPHVTYHIDGEHHLVTYSAARYLPDRIRYPHRRKKQALDDCFKEFEFFELRGFTQSFAKSFKHQCNGFDAKVIIASEDLPEEEFDEMTDELGTFRSIKNINLSLQVDLLQPQRYDLVGKTLPNPKRIIHEQLIEQTFPWCLITIFES